MNFQLYNDKAWTFPIKCQTAAGVIQPWPAGVTPFATSSSLGSLNALVTGSASAGFNLLLTPKVQASPGLNVTVSCIGMSPMVFTVDIVADPNILSVTVDSVPADVTSVPQNIPVGVGP